MQHTRIAWQQWQSSRSETSYSGKDNVEHEMLTDDREALEETICVYSGDEIVKTNRTIPVQVEDTACRVLVENNPDFHYELVESVILKYPLPWHNLTECDFTKTDRVIFNVALAKEAWASGELEDYKDYYRTYLQGTIRHRLVDNITAIIGELVPWNPYDRHYAARIGVSCGQRPPKIYVNADLKRNFCVMHISCNDRECDENTAPRSCWLNPMHTSCFFMADVFPMFPESLCQDDGSRVRLCTVGGAKRHDILASALASNASKYQDKVVVQVLHRSGQIPGPYINNRVEHFVEPVHSKSYVEYQRAVSKCHIMLPLLDPENNKSGYFRWDEKVRKVSGSLSQTVGYSFPVVMHAEMYYSYKDVLKGPVITYSDNKENFVKALDTMIDIVRESLPEAIRKACADPSVVRGKKCIDTRALWDHSSKSVTQQLPPNQGHPTKEKKDEVSASSSYLRENPKMVSPNHEKTASGNVVVALSQSIIQDSKPADWWLSNDTLLRGQEERLTHWEHSRKQHSGGEGKRIRSEYEQKLRNIANSPSNIALQAKANLLLKQALATFAQENYNSTDTKTDPVYEDIIVAVDLGREYSGRAKTLIGESMFRRLNGTCVVYGAGIAYEPSFEINVAKNFVCAVHEFDCTMLDRERLQTFVERQKDIPNLAFHPWCVGEMDSDANKKINEGRFVYDMSKLSTKEAGVLVRLEEIMDRLGHEDLDVLKFDIEGFEWRLFESILKSKKLPRQMSFELHTRHASRAYVPPPLVAGKGKEAVVELFDRLYSLGYRVVAKALNLDQRCAEFVVYRFYDEKVGIPGPLATAS